ncbi:MAG: SAVED domain-containing protein, partial [Chloroflexales bacterium]|nr:SAVED domain-containing protein [Chloroflexales bacterium]
GGYSGAPVIDPESGKVVAVVYLAESNGKRGRAVSISALPLIWPDAPAILRAPVERLPHDPILLPAPSMAPVYLAAHQRLRGAAHGQAGETVIDWTQAFVTDDPGPAVWEQHLIPDLERHMHAFRRDQQRRIALRAEARNTAGLVFGYVFCERAGFHIQYTDRDGAVWRTDGERQGPSPVNRSETTGRKKGTDVIVELAVTQGAPSVRLPVDAWIAEHRPPVHKRIMLERPRSSYRLTPVEGGVIAEQVCAIISDEAIPGGTVHLFGALPLGIALLIGWRLKAGRTIQFYDLHPATQRYQPTCLLHT